MPYDSKADDGESSIQDEDQELNGIPIWEVFSLTYLGYDQVHPEDQCGFIYIEYDDVEYGFTSSTLYSECKVDINKPSIKYGDQLPLIDMEPFCSFSKLEVRFDLFRGAYKGYIEVNSEHFEHKEDCLTQPRIRSVDGYGEIAVMSGYFSNAIVAYLEIKLLNIPHATAANVYGAIVATNSKFDYPSCTSMLFFKDSASSSIKVRHNGVIPLSKSRIGVPLDSTLYVDISLHCDGEHFKGTADFNPLKEKGRGDSKIIATHILVKVTWNCNQDINSSDDSDSTAEYDSDEIAEEEVMANLP